MERFRKADHLAGRVISGQAFIVNPKASMLYELDETGTFIWNALESCATVRQIAELMCREYDVTNEQAVNDVEKFLRELAACGLVVEA